MLCAASPHHSTASTCPGNNQADPGVAQTVAGASDRPQYSVGTSPPRCFFFNLGETGFSCMAVRSGLPPAFVPRQS